MRFSAVLHMRSGGILSCVSVPLAKLHLVAIFKTTESEGYSGDSRCQASRPKRSKIPAKASQARYVSLLISSAPLSYEQHNCSGCASTYCPSGVSRICLASP